MTKTIFAAAALAALGLAGAGMAVAQSAAGRSGRNVEISRTQVQAQLDARFARLDADGDGKITAADRQKSVELRFKQLDTDGNGSISLAELKAETLSPRAELGRDRGPGGHRGRRGGRGLGAAADTDGDGATSKAEFEAAALAGFDRADADHNGVLTPAERHQARGARRADRQASREAGIVGTGVPRFALLSSPGARKAAAMIFINVKGWNEHIGPRVFVPRGLQQRDLMARSVLIVDDDELIRDLLWRNMRELDFEAMEASSGAAAVEQVEKRAFDLVILDYAMPGMSGPAAAQEIRRIRPGQRLLLISGYAGTGVLKTGSGEIPLLGKPFALEELRAAVENILGAE